MRYSELEVFQPEDIPALPAIQPEGWRGVEGPFQFYLATPVCHPVKITCKRTLVGVGCAVLLGRTGWLAHIIVHQSHRSRGLGSRPCAVVQGVSYRIRLHKDGIHNAIDIGNQPATGYQDRMYP